MTPDAFSLRCALRTACVLLLFGWLAGTTGARASTDTIRVVAQRTGTFGWELDVIRTHGFDKAVDLTIETRELASTEAGTIALSGGATDLVVSDWLWVARERALGLDFRFSPYSSALCAIMVRGDSPVRSTADLKGRKLAVTGGPSDKSWLLTQAAMQTQGIELKTVATIVYGAPPLLFAKALQGEIDADLTFWNFAAQLEAKGFRRLATVEEMIGKLGVRGRPALLGYVFSDAFVSAHRGALDKFIAASRRAKELLATSDAEWQRIAPLVGTSDPATLKVYRDRYREGIPHRPLAEEEADARALFAVLAKIGGKAVVGSATELPAGTFYAPR